jgi:hypothetical protein
MQNAVAEQRAQNDTLSGTTTISLRSTRPAGLKQGRPEIEVIPEDFSRSTPLDEVDAVFCRDLLEFLGDFRAAAPKSRTVRRLGQAAVQNEPAARYLAPHEDLLFDFLRAYEDAPKMRPLSQTSATRSTPEAAGNGLGPIGTPAPVAEPDDTPFRVPPYVSAVSDNAATDEALLGPDEAWLEPQLSAPPIAHPSSVLPVPEPPTPAPVAQRPARAQVAKKPALASVPKRPAPVALAKKPDPAPVAQRPAPVPVTPRPAPVPVAERPAVMPVAERPAPMPVPLRPDPVPVAETAAPAAAAPSPAPAPVARRPDAKPTAGQLKKRAEPRPAPAPAVKPLGPAAARAKAIAEGLIV